MHDHADRTFDRLPVGMRNWNVHVLYASGLQSGDCSADCSANSDQSCIFQWAIYQKYDRRGHASPSGYGPLAGWFCKYL